MTEKEEFQTYYNCICQGVDLQYGKLSLCDLRNYRYGNVKNDRRYQLHCEDRNNPVSLLYDELGPAVSKFIMIKKRCRKMH